MRNKCEFYIALEIKLQLKGCKVYKTITKFCIYGSLQENDKKKGTNYSMCVTMYSSLMVTL